jgi:acetyltransferase-like isoleucine patch superfamily enzyme
MTPAHRARLLETGLAADVLDALELTEVTAGWPSWWAEQRNALYVSPQAVLNRPVFDLMVTYPFSDALIVVASDTGSLSSLLLGGDGSTVFIGPDTYLVAGEIYCGPGSSVILSRHVVGTRCTVVDARNGGSIVAEPDQLWAANVYIATDDMHRLEDLETGERLNPYGASVRLGRHVWLCRDAVVSGHAEVGDGCVVGLRSVVRGQKVPAHTAVAGTPARVIREGITWRGEDTP